MNPASELVDQIADVLLIHTWEDRGLGAKCACGATATTDHIAEHVARQVVVAVAHDLWTDGYDAAYEDARGVQTSYPNPTPSPYSEGGEETR